jgi:hypothetical protein
MFSQSNHWGIFFSVLQPRTIRALCQPPNKQLQPMRRYRGRTPAELRR